MMEKKAQASIFLILGVVVVIIVLILLILGENDMQNELKKGFEDNDIDLPIKACIDLELENAIFLLGYQGGYIINIPSTFLDSGYSAVTYWLYNGIYTAVPTSTIQTEIADYVKYATLGCLNQTISQTRPFVVESVEPVVSIFDDRVVAEVNVKATLTKGDVVKKTGMFRAEKKVSLGRMLEQVKNSVLEMVESQGLPITWFLLQDFPTFYRNTEDGYLIEVVDYNNTVKSQPYLFSYGITFAEPEELPPELWHEGPFWGKVGQEIYIKYSTVDTAYQDELTYSIVTFEPYNNMTIDSKTGIISYIPEIAGNYTAFVRVTNPAGLSDSDYLDIEVTQ